MTDLEVGLMAFRAVVIADALFVERVYASNESGFIAVDFKDGGQRFFLCGEIDKDTAVSIFESPAQRLGVLTAPTLH